MIAFRERTARNLGLELIVHVNRDDLAAGINPIDYPAGVAVRLEEWKTHTASTPRQFGWAF